MIRTGLIASSPTRTCTSLLIAMASIPPSCLPSARRSRRVYLGPNAAAAAACHQFRRVVGYLGSWRRCNVAPNFLCAKLVYNIGRCLVAR